MNRSVYKLFATTLTALAVTAAMEAHAYSDGAAFEQVAQSYSASARHQWVNALQPQASGDFIAVTEGASADAAFMRQVAYYTRDRLDRGGWINAYVDDGRDGLYATGNALLAVRIGDGATTRALV